MNRTLLAAAVAALLGLGFAAHAQTSPPVGGPQAKGNAPLKHPHTINDGAAKPGANSFTEGQARQHILNSGYTDVTGLTKGADGVWRGTATHNGAPTSVAMDFKGNVTEGAPQGAGGDASAMSTSTSSTSTASTGGSGMDSGAAGAGSMAAGAGATILQKAQQGTDAVRDTAGSLLDLLRGH